MAPATASSTATAEARPMDVTKGMSAIVRHSRAMMTVLPAKTIALPEVATEWTMESRVSIPLDSWSLCRVTRNKA